MFVFRIAEGHGAEPAVADRERLRLPVLGGLVITESESLRRSGGGQEERSEKYAGSDFHGPFHCAPFTTSRRCLCAIVAGERHNVRMLSYPSQCHFCKEINGTFIVRNGTEIL